MDKTTEMLDYFTLRISSHYLPLRSKNWNHADKVTRVREICSVFLSVHFSLDSVRTFDHLFARKYE